MQKKITGHQRMAATGLRLPVAEQMLRPQRPPAAIDGSTAVWEETEAGCRLSAELPCLAVGAQSLGSETTAIVAAGGADQGGGADAGRLGMELLRMRGLFANGRIGVYK
jgi:hypothetical protein